MSGWPLWASQLSKAVSHRLESGQGGCLLTKAWLWDSGLGWLLTSCLQPRPQGPCSCQSPPPAMITVCWAGCMKET